MDTQPLTIHLWPRAIMHIDADAFFSSCEQAIHPELRGRPVVTGKERGIIAAASYEAKAMGVKRGMRLFDAKRVCPGLVILPSDYETYSLFSIRIFEILRRFSPDVEEYSIDEAFVDLTGLRRSFHGSYGDISGKIQAAIGEELGISVSIGVSLTKVLAKMASKYKKPGGLTLIPGTDIHRYLFSLPLGEVWGIGHNTSAFLKKFGITTALEFTRRDEGFIKNHLSKPYQEIWHELNGRSVYPVVVESKRDYQSISKTKTFTPPSGNGPFILAQLSKNLENACIKARRHSLQATRLIIFLRGQDFKDTGIEIKLTRPTSYPAELLEPLRKGFNYIYRPNTLYRLTGIILSGLMPDKNIQRDLFDDIVKIGKMVKIYSAIDELSERFGKHTVQHASSIPVNLHAQHGGERGDTPIRKKELFKGENKRQRLGLPLLDIKV
jgi:DNA polymerase-4/DNA polymerase V